MRGEGDFAFCAGGDLGAAFKGLKADPDVSLQHQFLHRQFKMIYNLARVDQTVRISILNGVVMGAGVGLMWHSHIRVATEATIYAMPETQIGFFTDNGASYFLSRINGGDISLGLYVALTGYRVRAQELLQFGLATHFVTADNLPLLEQSLREKISKDSSNE